MRGSEITGTLAHDAGAYARCSYCGRYSDDKDSLIENRFGSTLECDCGKSDGWSGSFYPPTKDSVWNSTKESTDGQ